MKSIFLSLVLLTSISASATTAANPKLSIAEVKQILASEYPNQVAGDVLSDNATCEEIDLYFANHGLQMNDENNEGNIQSAKDVIDCVSSN